MKNRRQLVSGVLLAIAVVTGAYVLLATHTDSWNLVASLTNQTTSNTAASDGGVEVPLTSGAITTSAPGSKEYYSSTYHFSFIYPSGYSVREFQERGGGMTVVFQKPGELAGFQIFITAYSGTTITPERFKLDIPSGVVKSPVEVILGDNVHAVHFMSVAPLIGDSSETWFIRDFHLFEFTAYASQDAEMASILKTLRFDI